MAERAENWRPIPEAARSLSGTGHARFTPDENLRVDSAAVSAEQP